MSDVEPDRIEPEGSDADRLEQAADGSSAEAPDPAFRLPDDPEVPVVDAWEASQAVGDADETYDR